MESLIFISSNTIYRKDLERFGEKFLSKKFNIIIISFNNFKLENYKISQKTLLIKENNTSKIKKILENTNHKVFGIIDLMFPSLKSFQIKRFAAKKKINIIKLNNSKYPQPKKRIFIEKIKMNFNFFNPYREKILIKILNHVNILLNSFILYDYVLVCSDVDKKAVNSKTKYIDCHNFDYDIFLKRKNINNKFKNKIVYIDTDWLSHPDFKIHKANVMKIDKNNYKKKINLFFELIEKKLKKELIIAANPKSDLKKIKSLFNNRKIYKNKTFDLIKDSKCVIASKSTALSFPILLSKPIISFIFDDIKKTVHGPDIINQSELLGIKPINIDQNIILSKKILLKVNKKKYKEYIKNFIKHPKSDEKNTWEIFLNFIK